MAVVEVREVSPNRGGERDKLQGKFQRVFVVETNSCGDGPNVATSAAGIPQVGSPYAYLNEVYPAALVQTVRASHAAQKPRGDIWEVTVDYSDKFDLGSGGPGQQDPTNFTAEISWSSRPRSIALIADPANDIGVNSAGDPWDPPLERDVPNPVYRVEKYENSDPQFDIERFVGKVNSKEFMFADPHQALCREISGQRVFVQGARFWKVSYEIEFQLVEFGWDANTLDRGFRKLVRDADGNEHLEAILDAQGMPLAEPALLDGNGDELPRGGAPVYRSDILYDEEDFTLLNIENV